MITQAMLAQSAAGVDPVVFERLHSRLGQLERNTRDLQEAAMSVRMMPMSFVFSRFPRVVRDVAAKLGKELTPVGAEKAGNKDALRVLLDRERVLLFKAAKAREYSLVRPTGTWAGARHSRLRLAAIGPVERASRRPSTCVGSGAT